MQQTNDQPRGKRPNRLGRAQRPRWNAKNQEIEQARRALEEKATELALTSKYKSDFLANHVSRIAHAAE